MKKSIIYTLALSVSLFAACKEASHDIPASDVPAAVTSAFAAQYPTATDVKWEKETEDGKIVYEADFKADGKEMEAEYDESGTVVDAEKH